MGRPYAAWAIDQLERLVDEMWDAPLELVTIAEELGHRKTKRARKLGAAVGRRIDELNGQKDVRVGHKTAQKPERRKARRKSTAPGQQIVVSVPTINDEPGDFEVLFSMWHTVERARPESTVVFDFSTCEFLKQNAVAFIGGLARYAEHFRGGAVFRWETIPTRVRLNLARQGFLTAFGLAAETKAGHSIPYREDKDQNPRGVIDYLRSMWLGKDWVNVSPPLRDAIVGRVWEIYANAFEHGSSAVGVFACGQHYPKLRSLRLTVVDFGIGIPQHVRAFLGTPSLSAEAAIRWAFKRGTTTKPGDAGRGLGLDLLREFVKLNKGRLELFSHDGYALVDEAQDSFKKLPLSFCGTVVNITFRCDGLRYILASEVSTRPLF